MEYLGMQYIGGNWVEGHGERFSSVSPASGDVVWEGRSPSAEQIGICVRAAEAAFSLWSDLSLEKRAMCLDRFVKAVNAHASDLTRAISIEAGKPLWEARTEVTAVAGKAAPTLDAYKKRNISEPRAASDTATIKTRFRPHGVTAVLGPYNFPAHIPNGHIMPALLAGNTVIFKPSEQGALVAEKMVEYWIEAEMPTGVLSLLQGGPHTGSGLTTRPEIRGIFFTGSRAVGDQIQKDCADKKMCAVEMGGNSPLVVWETENLDAAVFATIQSSFITSGQRCSAARRLILRDSHFSRRFLARLVEVVRSLRIGPFDLVPEPYMGPVRNARIAQSILAKQKALQADGASVLLEAQQLNLGPCFLSPAIIDVTEASQRSDEEVFGPLLQVIKVEDFEQALAEANNTEYGLAAGLIADDPSLYHVFEKEIRAGVVNWNQQLTGASAWAPFGGIKGSGNWRPSAYLAADYVVYSSGSIESEKVTMPATLPPGVSFV